MSRLQPINEDRNKTNKNTENNKFSSELFLFIAINVLLVGVSTWQTFIGYEKDVAGSAMVAAVIALASGFLFLGLNFGIRDRRLKGESHWLMVIMFIIPLGISFFGNFNAFYSNQTKKVFLKQTMGEYKGHVEGTNQEATSALNNSINLISLERNFNSYKNQLKIEYSKPPSGWGSQANEKWTDLVKFLNDEGSSIGTNVLGKANKHQKYSRAIITADDAYQNLVDTRKSKVQEDLDKVSKQYSSVIKRMDSITGKSYENEDAVIKLLTDMSEAENSIRGIAVSHLNSSEGDIFSREQLEIPSIGEVGTIKHTLQKAFVEGEEPTAIVFGIFFSLIIDLAALIYVLVFYKYNKASKNAKGPVSVGPREI